MMQRIKDFFSRMEEKHREASLKHYIGERNRIQRAINIRLEKMPDPNPGMNRYDDTLSNTEQSWFDLRKIVVGSEADKEQLLLASRYIHDFHELDTGYMAANYIAHLYMTPCMIVVDPSVKIPEE